MAFTSNIDLQLPVAPTIKDPESFYEFNKVYNSLRIMQQVLQETSGVLALPNLEGGEALIDTLIASRIDRAFYTAGTDLEYGEFVHIEYSLGPTAVKAYSNFTNTDATASCKFAHGFVNSYGGALAGTPVEVAFSGLNKRFAGLTIGKWYHLADIANAGSIVQVTLVNGLGATPTVGDFRRQKLGFAVAEDALRVQIDNPL